MCPSPRQRYNIQLPTLNTHCKTCTAKYHLGFYKIMNVGSRCVCKPCLLLCKMHAHACGLAAGGGVARGTRGVAPSGPPSAENCPRAEVLASSDLDPRAIIGLGRPLGTHTTSPSDNAASRAKSTGTGRASCTARCTPFRFILDVHTVCAQ